ncbi:VWA domain-containing protein [Candidatus Woesearchaeota archaeon]|nr:VWA domain-containing protein [Candidatus Woesearchaeota archaeon]
MLKKKELKGCSKLSWFSSVLQYMDNQAGLYAFIAAALIVLIYLIKPKPRDKTIPSLIFIMKQSGKAKKQSFFRRLVSEFLFFLHLLIILLLAASATQPFFFSDLQVDAENTVLILDISASMATKDGLSTRFERMQSEAKSNLDGKISIILAGNEPFAVLDGGKKSDAISVIESITPTASLSNIGNSILTANDLLKEKKGIIVVISDFITTEGLEADVAKKTVEAKGRIIKFVNVKKDAKNIGIVDLQLEDDKITATIHNYNTEEKIVTVKFNQDSQQQVKISQDMSTKVSFSPIQGINKLSIDVNNGDDDLLADNIAYASYPLIEQKKILLISNKQKTAILPALQAYKESWNNHVSIDVAEPPKLPIIDHDLIIIDGFDKTKLPNAVIENIDKLVSKGKTNLIVTPQDDFKETKIAKIFPFEILGKGNETEVFNQLAISDITKDVSFSKVNKYLRLRLTDAKSISLAATPDNDTIILISEYNAGLIMYYGINDQESNFRFQISYPIFWQQTIDYMLNKQSLQTLNYKVHDKLLYEDAIQIQTPTKNIKSALVDFDEAGVYKIKGKDIAVNLLNKKESNVNALTDAESNEKLDLESSQSKEKMRLLPYIVYAIIAFLFIELLYIKVRGDL